MLQLQIDESTRQLLVQLSELIDQRAGEEDSANIFVIRNSRKEFTALLKSILSMTNPTQDQVAETNLRLKAIIENSKKTPQPGREGLHDEEYIRAWQTSLMSAAGVLVGISLAALNFLPLNLVWYFGLPISSLVFIAALAFGLSAWFALDALGTVALAVHAGKNAYDVSMGSAGKARKTFLIGLALIVTAIFIYALTKIPDLHAVA